MFALVQSPFQYAFPSTSFPLSPLNPNAHHARVEPNMTSKTTPTMALPKRPNLFSSSRVHYRPALTRRDPQKLREKRRFEFLHKVKEQRDEKKFEARNEKLQQIDAIAEQKAWEQQQEEEATRWSLDFEDEDTESEEYDRVLEEFMSQENMEIEAMTSSIDEQPLHNATQGGEMETGGYGSDDEDYDALLMEALSQVEAQKPTSNFPPHEDSEMDVSVG